MPKRWDRKIKKTIPSCDFKNITKGPKLEEIMEVIGKQSLLQHEKTFFNYKFLYHPTEKAYVAYSEDKYDYAY